MNYINEDRLSESFSSLIILSTLILLMLGIMSPSIIYASDKNVESNIRMYPDVWDKYIPGQAEGREYYFFKKEGDYLFSYYDRFEMDGDKKNRIHKLFSFFTDSSPLEIELEKLLKTYKLTPTEKSIELLNGNVVISHNSDPREPKRCPQTLNNYMSIKLPDGNEIRKSVLVLLDKPRLTKVQPRCVDSNESEYYEKVVSIWGRYASLDDGTFIIIPNDGGVFLRLDDRIRTRSQLLGKKIFIVDTDKVEDFTRMVRKHGYQYTHDKLVDYLKGEK